jgi:hypothetical protein
VREGRAPTPGVPPHLEPQLWSEVGAYDPDKVLGSFWKVHQHRHAFTLIGQPVAFYASTNRYELADARRLDRAALGLIREIIDQDTFVVQSAGEIPFIDDRVIIKEGPHGPLTWEPGNIYYVSEVPGFVQLKSAEEDGFIGMPIVVPTETMPGTANYRGVILGWGPEGHRPGSHHSPTPPPHPIPGDLWYREDNFPGLYIYLKTGSNSQWVQTNG